jgi:hypothetical protein
MNAYQEKWIEVLHNAHIADWKIELLNEDIYVEMPNVTDLKVIRDNLPEVLGALSLDNTIPKERLKFIFHNGHENFEYIFNPDDEDLNKE